jgi:leucyl-tRNA synthetase
MDASDMLLCSLCLPTLLLAGKLAELGEAAEGGVFLMAATLRPETMYGQTNCWALPEGRYGAYKGLKGEVYVMTYRSALNLSYQVRSCFCLCCTKATGWCCGCVSGTWGRCM